MVKRQNWNKTHCLCQFEVSHSLPSRALMMNHDMYDDCHVCEGTGHGFHCCTCVRNTTTRRTQHAAQATKRFSERACLTCVSSVRTILGKLDGIVRVIQFEHLVTCRPDKNARSNPHNQSQINNMSAIAPSKSPRIHSTQGSPYCCTDGSLVFMQASCRRVTARNRIAKISPPSDPRSQQVSSHSPKRLHCSRCRVPPV